MAWITRRELNLLDRLFTIQKLSELLWQSGAMKVMVSYTGAHNMADIVILHSSSLSQQDDRGIELIIVRHAYCKQPWTKETPVMIRSH